MAVPLTIGRYKPPSMPGPQYGGAFMYPGGAQPRAAGGPQISGGTGITMPGAPGGGYLPGQAPAKPPAGAELPTIQLPQGTAGTPAYTPDYSSMIGGSWEVGAAESAMASQMADARAAFQAQLRQNFIDLGYSGDMNKENGLGDFSKYIDKATIQKAIDNKYSAYSQIAQQQAKTNAANDALLASSGLSLGGTTTATATSTTGQAEQARYEGLRNFLSGGQTGLSNLTAMKNQLAQGVLQARFAAAQRLAQMYPATPAIPATPAPAMDWNNYPGGAWNMPGGGWIVPSGIPGDQGQPQPWYVGPGSGTGGDLSWLNPHV